MNEEIVINDQAYIALDPIVIIKTFIVTDISYDKYDSKDICEESWLEDCIRLANKGMRARIKKELILANKNKIESYAKNIPSNLNIENASKNIFGALRKIFSSINSKGTRNAKITKVLHKRFPNLIPIVDNIVGKVYFKGEYRGDDITTLLDVIKKIRQDFIRNKDLLNNIKFELKKEGIGNLTSLRIFDGLLWAKGMDKRGILFRLK
jgi:hypothetical protein